ncbi:MULTISPECIES: DUF3060 domain-containing protein [unclassified Sphingomonas]|uniref:DUF3060 domain-containing protein n=1 Tax=unclassified Sphingomonas TaxID=196159 RepID=UPI0006F45A01|nr:MULTISPECIES: DUF3060 domain-containing protein [unclassified Sphingomonas]KQM57845.1 hypothetical protein ASE65_11790 [Sphingomonas sp. Leaf16]KQN12870.1 hypothetical protein ASE81_06020 [Sphingomonas sp. Leaf29]KQN19757.1 hypothetical protein ASE83_05945 [Sphingomonas sp. Leaf32]
MVVRFALLVSALVLPATLPAQVHQEGAGATQELDCDGGPATVRGAGNTMRIIGRCSALVIEGAGNRVEIDLAPRGSVRIAGASNTVLYRTPDGSKARVSVAGAGNRVSFRR